MNAILAALERLLVPLAKALLPHIVDHIGAALEARNAATAPVVATVAAAADQAIAAIPEPVPEAAPATEQPQQ